MHRAHRRALLLAGAVTLSLASIATAQEEPEAGESRPTTQNAAAEEEAKTPQGARTRQGDEATATQSVNQLANLFQIPVAHNIEWGLGTTGEGFRYLVTARPRIPIALGDEWMVVTTAFIRFHFVDDVIAADGTGVGSAVGMGDSEIYALVTPPRLVDGLLFGLGPFAILPAGNPRFGSVNVGVGPGAAVSWQGHGVVLNLTVLHAFSFVDDETDYSQSQLLPVVSYVFDTGTAIVFQSETVYEWKSDTWIVPLNLGVSQVLSLSPLFRMNIGIQGKWWPASPVGGPDVGLRVITTLLFPELDEGDRS